MIKGTTTVAKAARTYELTPAEIEEWLEECLMGMKNNLRNRPKDVAECKKHPIMSFMKEALKEMGFETRRLIKNIRFLRTVAESDPGFVSFSGAPSSKPVAFHGGKMKAILTP